MATEKTPPNELPVISVRVRCADHACTYQLVVYPKDIEPLLEAVQRMLVIKMWNHRW